MRSGLIVVLAACHARLGDPGVGPDAHDPLPADGGTIVDAAPPAVDAPLGPWGTPMKITGASDPNNGEDDSTMSWSGTELVYAVSIAGGAKHLFTMSYTAGAFGTPSALPFGGTFDAESPRFSTDDLTLYFGSNRGGASLDIYATTRDAIGSPWKTPALVTGPNTGRIDKWYAPCDGVQYLVIGTNAAGDTDIYEGIAGAAPAAVPVLNSSPGNETGTFLTRDCLTVYFASTRDGTNDLWTSHRTSVNNAWAPPAKVTDFGIADNEEDPWLSPTDRVFTFAKATTAAPAQKDLYISVR